MSSNSNLISYESSNSNLTRIGRDCNKQRRKLSILPPNRGSLPEVIRRENPPPPTKGYLWYPPPALNGAEAGGAPRERRRAKAAPYPRPRGPSPQGCTWDQQKGGWWKADGTEWQRKRIPEPGAPKGPAKWTIAFEEECAARKAREKAVRFDTALRCIAPSTSTRSITRCAAPVPRGAGVTSGRRCGKLAMHWGLGSSGFCRRSTLQAGRGLSHAPGRG